MLHLSEITDDPIVTRHILIGTTEGRMNTTTSISSTLPLMMQSGKNLLYSPFLSSIKYDHAGWVLMRLHYVAGCPSIVLRTGPMESASESTCVLSHVRAETYKGAHSTYTIDFLVRLKNGRPPHRACDGLRFHFDSSISSTGSRLSQNKSKLAGQFGSSIKIINIKNFRQRASTTRIESSVNSSHSRTSAQDTFSNTINF